MYSHFCPNFSAQHTAITSISIATYAWGNSWVSEAITRPLQSRVATPTPLLFSCLNIAPLKFGLNIPLGGGFHTTLGFCRTGIVGGRMATNSLSFSVATYVIWSMLQLGMRWQIWFHLFQIFHTIIAKRLGCAWFYKIQESSFLKSKKLLVWWQFHWPNSYQTEFSSLQDHKARTPISSSPEQRSHLGEIAMDLHRKFTFVGIESLQAHQPKF